MAVAKGAAFAQIFGDDCSERMRPHKCPRLPPACSGPSHAHLTPGRDSTCQTGRLPFRRLSTIKHVPHPDQASDGLVAEW